MSRATAPSTGKRSERIVNQIFDRRRNIVAAASSPLFVERMRPIVIAEHEPKGVELESLQIFYDRDQPTLHSLIVERSRKIVVIEDLMTILWSEDHRVFGPRIIGIIWFAEEFPTFAAFLRAPRLSLSCHLAHSYGDLRRAQIVDFDRM